MADSDDEYETEGATRHSVFVMDSDDTYCNFKGWKQICIVKLFEIIFISVSLIIMDSTYGLTLNNALIIISLILLFQFCFAIISSLVYAYFTYCMCCKCCQHNSVMYSFSYYEYMINTVCIWYSIQLCSLLLLSTILFVSHHPYLMNRFQDIFYSFENDITLRPYFQTTQYSAVLYEPSTTAEIQYLIQTLGIQRNQTIRAIGSAHSSSPLFTNDILISLANFRYLKLRLIEDGYDENTVIIGAGWTVQEIEDLLYYHNYVLLGFGSVQSETFAGLLGTGTYGAFGSMNQYLISVWLIDGHGNDVYINKYVNETLLSAIKVNLGLLGVIYKLEFAIQPEFNVQLNVDKMSVDTFHNKSESEFKELMKIDRANGTRHIGVKVFINPWNYVVETFSESISATETGIDYSADEDTQLSSFVNDIVLPLSCLMPSCFEYMHWMKQQVELVDIEENVYTAKSVLNVFDANVMYLGFVYAIPFEHCQSAMFDVRELMKDAWPAFATVIPLLQSDDYGYLSYGFDRSVCMIEFYPNMCDTDRLDAAKQFEATILNKYEGVGHWATRNLFGDSKSNLNTFYSKIDVFESIRNEFDPNNVFLNEYIGKYLEMDEYKDVNITHSMIDAYDRNELEWSSSTWYALFLCMFTTCVIGICMIFGKYTSTLMPFAPKHVIIHHINVYFWMFVLIVFDIAVIVIIFYGVLITMRFIFLISCFLCVFLGLCLFRAFFF
eukprot:259094_1